MIFTRKKILKQKNPKEINQRNMELSAALGARKKYQSIDQSNWYTTKSQNERTRCGLKIRFSKKCKEQKTIWSFGTFNKKKHQLEWSSIKILTKENNYSNR